MLDRIGGSTIHSLPNVVGPPCFMDGKKKGAEATHTKDGDRIETQVHAGGDNMEGSASPHHPRSQDKRRFRMGWDGIG